MEKPLNYEQTFKIEIVNEFANGVHAQLLNYIFNNGIDINDKSNSYVILLDQLSEFLNKDLFEMSIQELDGLKIFWKCMDELIGGITKENANG